MLDISIKITADCFLIINVERNRKPAKTNNSIREAVEETAKNEKPPSATLSNSPSGLL